MTVSSSLDRFHLLVGPTRRREVGQCSAGTPVAVHLSALREGSMRHANVPFCLISAWVGREDLDEGALGVVNGWHFVAGSPEGLLQEVLLAFATRLWTLRLAGYEGDPLASIHEARLRDVLEREAYLRSEPRANVADFEFPEPLFAGREARISGMIADRTRLTGGYWGWFGDYCLQRADNPEAEERLRLHVDATARAPVDFPAFLVAAGVTAACFWHDMLV